MESDPNAAPPDRRTASRFRFTFPRTRHWDYLVKDEIAISTSGIPAAFREAFLGIMLGTRDCYRGLFGEDLVGRVELNVRKAPGQVLRLWTNGADRVYLTLSRKGQLDEPRWSGVRYLHGIPHELGHIVLYRALINLSVLKAGWGEGWAIYLSSFFAVPYLYETRGPELWPHPYNYLETEGPAPWLKRLGTPPRRAEDPIIAAVQVFHKLEERLDREGFGRFFGGLLRDPIRSDEFVKKTLDIAGLTSRPRRP